MPDVTIIGGGPAGSVAAILLARGGWDVTLIEQSRFPRDKVCGECLSALGFDVLTRIGLGMQFHQLGAVRLDRAEVHAPGGRSMRVALPAPMWGLSRHALDGMLLDEARAAGATIRQPARCESIKQAAGAAQRSPGSVGVIQVLRIRDLTTNKVETVDPSHLILADGKAAFANDSPSPTGDFGIKTHFATVDGPRDAIELFGVRGSYGGLAAIEGERWNAAFSVPTDRLKAHRGDLDALFTEVTSENPVLTRRLAGARRVSPWLAAPLPRFSVRASWLPGVIPVGNAAAAIEPIGGEGMGLAMRSAELAAISLLAGNFDGPSLRREYQQLWNVRRAACRAAGIAASRPRLGNGVTAFRLPRVAIRAALRLVGK